MGGALSVADAQVARESAMEAAKSTWRYNIPGSFHQVKNDKKDKSWSVEATCFEQKPTFKTAETTDDVSAFRIGKIRSIDPKLVDHFALNNRLRFQIY